MVIMPSMADLSGLEKQAKDAVAAALAGDAGVPAAVPVMCQQISHAARTHADPKPAVIAVCRGAMHAVLLGGRSVPDAAIGLMEALPNMSLMMRAGPEDLMSWVMEGVADVTPVAGVAVRDAVSARIEEKYMGASSIFNELCDAALKKSRG